jgi:predicted DCC family thiol-disulfide oxidoreductase YuxK
MPVFLGQILSIISENMKKHNKTLVYDDACPMCVWYTGAFVQTGLLDAAERKPFSAASPELLHAIDWKRSKNEIPLLDLETNKVLYGIDALLEILGQRWRCIKTMGNQRIINWLLKKLYNFISYNRKVIVARKTPPHRIDCTPDHNPFYRVLFMTVFLLFNTLMLFPVHTYILTSIPWYSLTITEFQVLHLTLAGLNCLVSMTLPARDRIDYLGQVNMLALVTILLLLPLMFINQFYPATWLNYTYLFLMTLFVIKEYYRRMDYAAVVEKYPAIIYTNLVCLITFVVSLFVL